jgi:hypothetical protein
LAHVVSQTSPSLEPANIAMFHEPAKLRFSVGFSV